MPDKYPKRLWLFASAKVKIMSESREGAGAFPKRCYLQESIRWGLVPIGFHGRLPRNDGIGHQLGKPHDIHVQSVVFVQLSKLVSAIVAGSHHSLGTSGTDLRGLRLSGLQTSLIIILQGNQAASPTAADALAAIGFHLSKVFNTGLKDSPRFLK